MNTLKRTLQIMDEWLKLPPQDYRRTVLSFTIKLPSDELLDAVLIARVKKPEGGRDGFKYFCGVCHNKIRERRFSQIAIH